MTPTIQETTAITPWGEAHPMRGKNHEDIAVAFVTAFPVGSVLSPDEFDSWTQHAGILNVPTGAPKTSDAWKAHLQRRHELRYNINKAGPHPRMADRGVTPFVIDYAGGKKWEVRTPHESISRSGLPRKLEMLVSSHRRRLRYLMQSEDWDALSPYARVAAEALYDDITNFAQMTDVLAGQLAAKFSRLEANIKRAVESGETTPRNGGITMLLSGESGTSDAPDAPDGGE